MSILLNTYILEKMKSKKKKAVALYKYLPGPNLFFVWSTFQHAKAVFLFIPATVVGFDISGLGLSTNGSISDPRLEFSKLLSLKS